MKKLIMAMCMAVAASAASATDVTAVLTVVYQGTPVFQQTNYFPGLTDAEAKNLETSGMKQLDFAAKHQDKGGKYTIVWKWNDLPAIETQGMTLKAVNSTLRQGHKWLDVQITQSEKADKAGKAKPFGNK